MRWLVACVALAGGGVAQTLPDFGFMPDGGRGLVSLVFGTAEGAGLLRQGGDLAAWGDRIDRTGVVLEPGQARTLAGYLAINTPLADPARLPADGKDIALGQCQSCHSLFTGYLMQDRDVAGWLAIFKSPFHMTLTLTETERQTFADYSAQNMPLKPDQVPPDLRF